MGDAGTRGSEDGIIPDLPRTYDGPSGGQHLWIPGELRSPTGPVSPTGRDHISFKTAPSATSEASGGSGGSLKSLEEGRSQLVL